jgi:phage shock protein E
MKRLFAVSAVLALFLTGCGSSTATKMGPSEFQMKASEAGIVLLDVRTSSEFNVGHIANAINIDVEGMTFGGDVTKLDKTATYAVYCQSDRRSGIAVGKMKEAGFTNLFELDGGILAWQSAGYPTVAN